METTGLLQVAPSEELVPEYGPHPSKKHCGCADRITALEREIVQLHRLYRAGVICESTYRGTLQHLEANLAVLSRAF